MTPKERDPNEDNGINPLDRLPFDVNTLMPFSEFNWDCVDGLDSCHNSIMRAYGSVATDLASKTAKVTERITDQDRLIQESLQRRIDRVSDTITSVDSQIVNNISASASAVSSGLANPANPLRWYIVYYECDDGRSYPVFEHISAAPLNREAYGPFLDCRPLVALIPDLHNIAMLQMGLRQYPENSIQQQLNTLYNYGVSFIGQTDPNYHDYDSQSEASDCAIYDMTLCHTIIGPPIYPPVQPPIIGPPLPPLPPIIDTYQPPIIGPPLPGCTWVLDCPEYAILQDADNCRGFSDRLTWPPYWIDRNGEKHYDPVITYMGENCDVVQPPIVEPPINPPVDPRVKPPVEPPVNPPNNPVCCPQQPPIACPPSNVVNNVYNTGNTGVCPAPVINVPPCHEPVINVTVEGKEGGENESCCGSDLEYLYSDTGQDKIDQFLISQGLSVYETQMPDTIGMALLKLLDMTRKEVS